MTTKPRILLVIGGGIAAYKTLDLIENFVTYTELPGGLVKATAKNHQYLGVNNAIEGLQAESSDRSQSCF